MCITWDIEDISSVPKAMLLMTALGNASCILCNVCMKHYLRADDEGRRVGLNTYEPFSLLPYAQFI